MYQVTFYLIILASLFSLISLTELVIVLLKEGSRFSALKSSVNNKVIANLQKLSSCFDGLVISKYVLLVLLILAYIEFLDQFSLNYFAGVFILILLLLGNNILLKVLIHSSFIKVVNLVKSFLWLFLPISYLLSKLIPNNSSSLLTADNNVVKSYFNFFDRTDLQTLMEDESVSKKVDDEQSEIISKLIDIRTQRVYEAMTPRTDIVGVEITSSKEEVLSTFIESGYTKLPVYEETLDNIKGWVSTKDIFKQPEDWKSVIREVFFVPETKKSLDMLNEFLGRQISIAVIIDEFGGTAGIITLEDLIEEFFGEIRDEYDDVDEKFIKKLDSNSFVLSGKVEIDFLNEEHEINIPKEGDYETVAGYIMFKTGRIPQRSELLNLDNFTIQILKSDKTKIDFIKLTSNPYTK